MGALILHGSGKTNVKPASAAQDARWQRLADPDGSLPPDVRTKRAAMLERAHGISLSLAAAEARSRSKRKASPADNRAGLGGRRATDEPPQHNVQATRVRVRTAHREKCWRAECRAAFADYQTIAFLRDGGVVAWCHRAVLDDLSLRVDQWKHGEPAA